MPLWLQRFREPSTYAGLAAVLTSFGVVITPEAYQSVVLLGTGAAGVAAMVMREGGGK